MPKSLSEKILTIYPQLADDPTAFRDKIMLRNDGAPVPIPGTAPQEFHPMPNPDAVRDSNGDYIEAWDHPTLERPTQAQLDAVT